MMMNKERNYYDGVQLKTMQIPIPADIIRGVIREKSINFLAGEEGCGKSILAMNLAIAIVSGQKKFLNYDIIKKEGRVLYLNNEIQLEDFKYRYDIMTANVRKDLFGFVLPFEFPPLTEYFDELVKICKQVKPILIILDCFYWSHNSKENDNSEMKKLMRLLDKLRRETGAAILIVHHTKKGSRFDKMHNDNMRGAGVFGAAADTVIHIRTSEKYPGLRLIKPTKLRHSSDKLKVARLMRLDDETLTFQDLGETDENEHIAQYQNRKVASDTIDFTDIIKSGEVVRRKVIIERCREAGYSYDERTIDRLLREGKKSGNLQSPRAGSYSL